MAVTAAVPSATSVPEVFCAIAHTVRNDSWKHIWRCPGVRRRLARRLPDRRPGRGDRHSQGEGCAVRQRAAERQPGGRAADLPVGADRARRAYPPDGAAGRLIPGRRRANLVRYAAMTMHFEARARFKVSPE